MLNIFDILLAIVIETIFYCTIPIIIRLLKKKPFSNKMAWYLSTINFGLVFTTLRLVESKLLNVDYNSISASLFSGVLSLVNVYILKYDKNNQKNIFKSLKENYKKVLKTLIIIITILFLGSLVILLTTKIINNKVSKKINDNLNNDITEDINNKVELKKISSQDELEKIISNKVSTVIFYTESNCVFCTKALPVVEKIVEDYELTNIYNYEYTTELDKSFNIEGFPTMIIYKDGKFIDQKNGYSIDGNETTYYFSIETFLKENSVIK